MSRIVAIALLFISTLSGYSQDSNRPTQPDLPGDLMVDFGLNTWTDQPDNLPSSMFRSNSFGLYYTQRKRISDHFSVQAGLGFSFENMAIDNRVSWFRADDGTIGVDSLPTNLSLRKNKLLITYFEIPVEFRIHPLGTVAGEGFFIGLGAIGGVRMGARTKIKYDTQDETIQERLHGQFDLNRWKYGVQARLGFKTFHLFYKMYFNDQFSNLPEQFSSNPRQMTFGINLTGF